MKYRVHRLEVKKDTAQEKLEQFLNQLEGEVLSIVPYVTPTFQGMGATAKVDYLLIVEKVNQFKDKGKPSTNSVSLFDGGTAQGKSDTKYYQRMKPSAEFPFPPSGRIQFFVLTYAGAYWVDGDEEALVNGEHEFSSLFFAANDVITQVRLNSPDQ